MDKSVWTSKTFWVSIAGLAYGVGGYFAGYLDIQQATTAVQIALSAFFIRLAIK